MITNPRPLTTGEALLLFVAAAIAIVVARSVWPQRLRISLPALVAVSLLASVAVTGPFTLWSTVSDIRAAHGYSRFEAARVGPEDNGIDTTVVDRIAKRIPRHSTFVLRFAPGVEPAISSVFRVWSLTALLPRVALSDAQTADWIITFGASPRQLGLDASAVRKIRSSRNPHLSAWVGRRR